MAELVTHYRKAKGRALCGRAVPRKRLEGEFGCVNCSVCRRIWMGAALRVLTGAKAERS